jgi:hypothetical protein
VQVAVFTPSAVISPSIQVCSGASTTVSATGANSYTWVGIGLTSSLIVTPAVTTVYTVIAQSQSLTATCNSTLTTTVKVNALPSVSIALTRTTAICKGNTNTLTASGASTYSWSNASSSTSIVVNPTSTTIYSVTGTDANGCEDAKQVTVLVSQCNGISEYIGGQQLSVYPNPNAGEFTVRGDRELNLKLYNAAGQELRLFQLSDHNGYEVKISELSNGFYFIRSITEAGIRIVVNK